MGRVERGTKSLVDLWSESQLMVSQVSSVVHWLVEMLVYMEAVHWFRRKNC